MMELAADIFKIIIADLILSGDNIRRQTIIITQEEVVGMAIRDVFQRFQRLINRHRNEFFSDSPAIHPADDSDMIVDISPIDFSAFLHGCVDHQFANALQGLRSEVSGRCGTVELLQRSQRQPDVILPIGRLAVTNMYLEDVLLPVEQRQFVDRHVDAG